MVRHELLAGVHVVGKYDMDTLGAPFKVTLLDSVKKGVDRNGKEVVFVPDVVGLIGAVVRARVCHTQKLNGAEIKFIRNALGVKAKLLAERLDITPEHLSRCENGESGKVLSPTCEKELRLIAFLASWLKEPEELFTKKIQAPTPDLELKDKAKFEEVAKAFVSAFLSMKIETPLVEASVERPCNRLEFEFTRKPVETGPCKKRVDDDEDWKPAPEKLAVGF